MIQHFWQIRWRPEIQNVYGWKPNLQIPTAGRKGWDELICQSTLIRLSLMYKQNSQKELQDFQASENLGGSKNPVTTMWDEKSSSSEELSQPTVMWRLDRFGVSNHEQIQDQDRLVLQKFPRLRPQGQDRLCSPLSKTAWPCTNDFLVSRIDRIGNNIWNCFWNGSFSIPLLNLRLMS